MNNSGNMDKTKVKSMILFGENVNNYINSIKVYDSNIGRLRKLDSLEKKEIKEKAKAELNPEELTYDETLNRARKLTHREKREREERRKAYETW